MPLHLPPYLHGLRGLIQRYVGGLDESARRHIARKFDLAGQPNRQRAERKASRRGNELGVDRVAAFTVEHLA